VSGNNFVFQQDSALAHRALPCQEMPDFILPNMWPPNSQDLHHVDYEIWAVMQHGTFP